jgi:putative SOS response-associated peptidase YedK
MCYHAALLRFKQIKEPTLQDIISRSAGLFADTYMDFHINGFDFPAVPVYSSANPDHLQEYYWGLIPHWVKTQAEALSIRARTLNARSDTMYEKPSFRDSCIAGRRCLIPVAGIYEWHGFKGKKYPHYIQMIEESVFFIGGIWSSWVNRETGEILYTFSMVTTEANEMMASIHNDGQRMPVIISKESAGSWLDPQLSKDDVLALCQPYPSHLMKAHTISRLITSRIENTNVEEVQKHFIYPELIENQNSLFGDR